MLANGCSTTRLTDTSRTGIEQLLVSTAIENSLDQVNFSDLVGRSVYVDERFLECVDKKYVIAALRRRLLAQGVRVVEKPEEADLVLEVASAAVGTDRSDGFIGIPSVNIPGPLPVHTPEIRIISHTTQFGTAKISFTVYDAKQREGVGPGALAHTRVTNTNWFILGLGPINSGSLREELILARKNGQFPPEHRVALVDPHRVSRLARRDDKPAETTASPTPADSPPFPAATPWQPPPDLPVGTHTEEDTPNHRWPLWPPDPNLPALPLPHGVVLPLIEGNLRPGVPLPFLPGHEGQ